MAHEEKDRLPMDTVADYYVHGRTRIEEQKDPSPEIGAHGGMTKKDFPTSASAVTGDEAKMLGAVPAVTMTRPNKRSAPTQDAYLEELDQPTLNTVKHDAEYLKPFLTEAIDRTESTVLSEKGLGLLDSASGPSKIYNPRVSLFPPLFGTEKFAEEDEDTQTVSDEQESDAMQDLSATSDSFAMSRMNKYIELTHGAGKVPRKAYVEAYFKSQQKHLVAFCYSVGDALQVRLTEDNHRILEDSEIVAMSSCADVHQYPGSVATEKPLADSFVCAEQSSARKRRKSAAQLKDDESEPAEKKLRRMPEARLRQGGELLGTFITVRLSARNRSCKALVVGFRDRGPNRGMHKVYYTVKQSTNVLDLSKTKWFFDESSTASPNSRSLLGKRIVVYKHPETLDNWMKELLANHLTPLPFEAFILRCIDSFNYEVLYTQDDTVEELRLAKKDKWWNVLESGVVEADQVPLISWSNPYTCNLELKTRNR